MFTWICQKCGSEVPPSENDCPNCRLRTVPPPKSDSEPVLSEAAPPPQPPVYTTPAPKRVQAKSVSPIAIAAGTTIAILAVLAVLYLLVLPRGSSLSKVAPLESPGGPGSSTPVHPLAKYLEITGVRIAEGSRGQAKVSYLLVNHSPADLPELTAQISVNAGDRPVFDFPATIPSIGPFESKDLTTSVKTNLKPYEFPDWTMVKPVIRITSER